MDNKELRNLLVFDKIVAVRTGVTDRVSLSDMKNLFMDGKAVRVDASRVLVRIWGDPPLRVFSGSMVGDREVDVCKYGVGVLLDDTIVGSEALHANKVHVWKCVLEVGVGRTV